MADGVCVAQQRGCWVRLAAACIIESAAAASRPRQRDNWRSPGQDDGKIARLGESLAATLSAASNPASAIRLLHLLQPVKLEYCCRLLLQIMLPLLLLLSVGRRRTLIRQILQDNARSNRTRAPTHPSSQRMKRIKFAPPTRSLPKNSRQKSKIFRGKDAGRHDTVRTALRSDADWVITEAAGQPL